MDLSTLMVKLRAYDNNIDQRILNIYQWGSRVYGTITPESDWDFIIVSTKSYPFTQPNTLSFFADKEYNPDDYIGHYEIFDDGEVNVTFIDWKTFQCNIMSHRLEMLESLFLKPEQVWKKTIDIEFKLDLEVFRKAVSWEAVRTYHKAEVKMNEGNIKKGKKELFHSLRYLMFALQIIRTGRINDFEEANGWWEKIKEEKSNYWEDHRKLFSPVFHDLRTHLCDECPNGVFHSKYKPFKKHQINNNNNTNNNNNNNSDNNISTKLQTVRELLVMGIDLFCKTYNIFYQRHSIYPYLVFLQHNKKRLKEEILNETIIKECNGLILDERNNWNVISLPYYTFYNYGMDSTSEGNFDWNSLQVSEKLDGDLSVLFYYNDQWLVASKRSIEGEDKVCSSPTSAGMALREVFFEVWRDLSYPMPSRTDCCYMFELIHPNNRYAVKYTSPSIVLHGVRDMKTFDEIDPYSIAETHGWKVVRKLELESKGHIQEACSNMSPYITEGCVVRDKSFQRIIFKSPYHVSLTCLSLNCSTSDEPANDLLALKVSKKDMMDVVRHDDEAEFINYFPKWASLASSVRQDFENFINHLEGTLLSFSHLSQRDFAEGIQDLASKPLLFYLRKDDAPSPREYHY